MNPDPDSQSLLAQILLLVVLTLINAFLAASEIAVVSINKNRIEQKAEDGDKKAKKILKILENPTNFFINHSSWNYVSEHPIRSILSG